MAEQDNKSAVTPISLTATPMVDSPIEPPPNQPDEYTNTRDFGILPIPRSKRYDPTRPFKFTLLLNIIFGFASTCTVANLYYCQPLLIQFSESFGVSYSRVSNIPTLSQAGYATGLLFITPLGDLVPRRPLLLGLIATSGTLALGMAVCQNIVAFQVLSYLIGVSTVTSQVLCPLAADLAPPEKRASAVSIVFSGLLLGILCARLLAGIIAEHANWRDVYFMGMAVQYFCLILLYLVLPDWPSKARKDANLTYFKIMKSLFKYATTEPLLIQTCFVTLCCSAIFTNFWVTLTFLLGGPPYHYSTQTIGLFGLLGILGVCTTPIVGRLVDRLEPLLGLIIAIILLLVIQGIQTGLGGISVVAVIIAAFGVDVGIQMQQISNIARIYSIDPHARARINSVFVIFVFFGQVTGTSAGTAVFIKYGWRAASALSMGLLGIAMLLALARGPHCDRKAWFGWQGGFELTRRKNATNGVVEGTETVHSVESDDRKDGDEECEKRESMDDEKKVVV